MGFYVELMSGVVGLVESRVLNGYILYSVDNLVGTMGALWGHYGGSMGALWGHYGGTMGVL